MNPVTAAISRLGKPYRWGATGPDAFDCSGLVQWSFAQAGITIPRTSQQQAVGGQPVNRADLEPGDIVIYYPDASHVGLYAGDGQVIHASTAGKPVTEVPIDRAGPYRSARRYTRKATPMTLFYPDVSNNNWHNTTDAVTFLSKLTAEGFGAVAHKVTEGVGYRDPYWPAVRDWCVTNNMLVIGYHYVTTGDPTQQAANYAAHVGDKAIPCMLDFEANSGDLAQFWAVARAFNAAGIAIRLSYIPQWYWTQIGRPDMTGVPGLVSSSYPGGNGYASTLYLVGGGESGSGWAPYGGIYPQVWQFTDKAMVAGITVDANAFKGSLDDFKTLLGITTTPTPAPTPGGTVTTDPAADNQIQLRGPGLHGWPQLDNLTVVDALAVIGEKLGIDGFTPPGRAVLGRYVEHDPRSRQYPAQTSGQQVSVLWAHNGPVLDQGNVGACTGNALADLLNTDPFTPARPNGYLTEDDALKLYELATTLDNVPGQYPPSDTGSTGLAVCKAAQQLGYLTGYQHTFTFDDFTAALSLQPVIVGTAWTEDMFTPDENGVVQPTGAVAGGHEYCALGVDFENQVLTFLNSWGASWGVNGRFKMSFDDFQTLLADQGDVTVPRGVNVHPAPTPTPAPAPIVGQQITGSFAGTLTGTYTPAAGGN